MGKVNIASNARTHESIVFARVTRQTNEKVLRERRRRDRRKFGVLGGPRCSKIPKKAPESKNAVFRGGERLHTLAIFSGGEKLHPLATNSGGEDSTP